MENPISSGHVSTLEIIGNTPRGDHQIADVPSYRELPPPAINRRITRLQAFNCVSLMIVKDSTVRGHHCSRDARHGLQSTKPNPSRILPTCR